MTFQFPMGQYYPSLESLHINCGSLLCLPLQLLPKHKDLHIYYCKNLESLSAIEVSLRDLTSLELHEWPNFVSFPWGGLCAPNLTKIKISNCKKLVSLPKRMHNFLPFLLDLNLYGCPEHELVPKGGFPSNLQILTIHYCGELFGHRMEWGL